MERTGTTSANKYVAGSLIPAGPPATGEVTLREPTRGAFSRSQSMWERPKPQHATYAQQYLHAYNSRWMMQRDSAMSTYTARQSVMSRMQESPAFLRSKTDSPASQ